MESEWHGIESDIFFGSWIDDHTAPVHKRWMRYCSGHIFGSDWVLNWIEEDIVHIMYFYIYIYIHDYMLI